MCNLLLFFSVFLVAKLWIHNFGSFFIHSTFFLPKKVQKKNYVHTIQIIISIEYFLSVWAAMIIWQKITHSFCMNFMREKKNSRYPINPSYHQKYPSMCCLFISRDTMKSICMALKCMYQDFLQYLVGFARIHSLLCQHFLQMDKYLCTLFS